MKAERKRQGPPAHVPLCDLNAAEDSTQQTEDLGSNAVEGLNWDSFSEPAGFLSRPPANRARTDLLSEEYDALFKQWSREMGHVANIVGGIQKSTYYGDANQRFFRMPLTISSRPSPFS
jgi:hypothetical protein